MDDTPNLTPLAPAKATDFVTVAATISILRIWYGQEAPGNQDGVLLLPPHFGRENGRTIDAWFDRALLTRANRMDLGLPMDEEEEATDLTDGQPL